MKLKGTITALVTPFDSFRLNEEGLARNIRFQIAQGIDGIVPLGSTGEAATLSDAEQNRVIAVAVKEAKGKVPVIVGTGTNSTQQTIEKTNKAKDLGADMALIVAPYYNKPTQEGLYRHFEVIANNVDIPIIVYNNPARSVVNIEPKTLLRIAELPGIIGVKEASGNLVQVGEILLEIKKRKLNFSVLSGEDICTYPMMALGADGVISVVSNLVPTLMMALVHAALVGNYEAAREVHYQLQPLFKAAFIETNPVPIKTAMALCGMAAGDCRLPLCALSEQSLTELTRVLTEMDLIQEKILVDV